MKLLEIFRLHIPTHGPPCVGTGQLLTQTLRSSLSCHCGLGFGGALDYLNSRSPCFLIWAYSTQLYKDKKSKAHGC